MTMEELFENMGYDPDLMLHDAPIDVSDQGWEIETWDIANHKVKWADIKHIVVKDETEGYRVSEIELIVAPQHRFWAQVDDSKAVWIEARHCVGHDIQLMNVAGEWISCIIVRTRKKTKILDIEVKGPSCYFSNGILSHNTLYGDPDVTPGGKAIPFHASVRVKLTSGTQIKGRGDRSDEVVAIKVIATTVKNKIAAPRRKAEFEIHFGVGIKEHEQLLAVINRLEEITLKDGTKIRCGGNGTRKEFMVTGPDGKLLHQKKFYKHEFDKVMMNPTWRPYIDELFDRAFIKSYVQPTLESEMDAEEAMAEQTRLDSQIGEGV